MAADADLASTATIYLGGFVSAIESAVANAAHLGAQSGDVLKLASISSTAKSTPADGETKGLAQLDTDVTAMTMNGDTITSCYIDSLQGKAEFDAAGAITTDLTAPLLTKKSTPADGETKGLAQLDTDVTAMTMNGDTITSCYIDSLQGKAEFDAAGAITTDLTAPLLTKNQLGEDYGMKAWGSAIAEWNEQAASFAAYVTGKTPADVAGIAVNEKTAPTDADLATSVTIAVGGFQALIAKAAGN